MQSFSSIQFGLMSAEAELRQDRRLLDQGFLDRPGFSVETLLDGPNFLILGYKGSGKSSVAEHVNLRAERDHGLYVSLLQLADFPFDSLTAVVPGEGDVSVRASLAWSLLLSLKLLESIAADEQARDSTGEIDRIAGELQKLGLMTGGDLGHLVLTARETKWSIRLARIFEVGRKTSFAQPLIVLSHVRDELRRIIASARTLSKHLMFVDGLDETYADFEKHFPSIASLIAEADRLNARLDRASSLRKVNVLCRTDIFERLPGPNSNKMRDFAMTLDWFKEPGGETGRPFQELTTHRARLAGYEGDDVLGEYLPEGVMVKGRRTPVRTMDYLLERTRHTPRDFLQLLFYIQREAGAQGDYITPEVVARGAQEYSARYFVPELKNELQGYFTPDQTEAVFRILGGLRKGQLSLQQLQDYADHSGEAAGVDLQEAVRVLFNCGGVGNLLERTRPGVQRKEVIRSFKYKNQNAALNLKHRLVIHRGAWYALNLTT